MRDHEPILELSEFDGWYDREGLLDIPLKNQSTLLEATFQDRFIQTRRAFHISQQIANILRVHLYPRIDEATRRLVLTTGGNLYDTTYSTTVPILTIATMVDFSVLPIFNRVYITPHNGVKGLSGEKVYVYDAGDGTNVARVAAGRAPLAADSTGTLTAANGAAGVVTAGLHIIAVAYESKSGFITKYGPQTYVQYTSPGSVKINLTNLPIGPAWVAKRHILVSQVIPVYDGNQDNYELYFVDEVADNVTTTKTIDFYDSALVNSADYLLDQLAEIPASIGLSMYSGRMVSYGDFDKPGIARLSKKGDPESFSSIDGFIVTDPQQGGGLKNSLEMNTVLYLFKTNRTYGITDNGGEPSEWSGPNLVDGAIGTEINGIIQTGETSQDPANDAVLVIHKTGLYSFDGRYPQRALSWKIDNYWRLSVTQGLGVYDWVRKQITLTNPANRGELLHCDISASMTAEGARWSRWSVCGGEVAIQSIWLEVTSANPQMYLAGNNTTVSAPASLKGIYQHQSGVGRPTEDISWTESSNNAGAAVDHLIELLFKTGYIGMSDGSVTHFGSANVGMVLREVLGPLYGSRDKFRFSAAIHLTENLFAEEILGGIVLDVQVNTVHNYEYLILKSSRLAYFRFTFNPCSIRSVIIYGKPVWTRDPSS